MKIAVMIQCHKSPEQINLLLDCLKHPSFDFFIHIDKKSKIKEKITLRDDVIILPDEYRVDVRWAKISQIDAALNLFRYSHKYRDYDFYWLCSGQDFPIKTSQYMMKWFETHADNDFVELKDSKNAGIVDENNYDKRNTVFYPQWMLGGETWKRIVKRLYIELTGGYSHTFRWARRSPVNGLKFYFGSQWVCLSRRSLIWILDYLNEHPEYYRFMQNCNCPDESFFQTLLMNSPYADHRMNYLHYVDWSEGKHSPKVLRIEDRDRLLNSDMLMARKFDLNIDSQIISQVLEEMTYSR